MTDPEPKEPLKRWSLTANAPAFRRCYIGLAIANVVTLLPFVFWFTFWPAVAPEFPVPVTSSFSERFVAGLTIGLACCVVVTLLVAVPALFRLARARKSGAESYFLEITIWVLVLSSIFGIPLALINSEQLMMFLISAGTFFISFSVPAYFAGLTYWYAVVRTTKSRAMMYFLIALFLLWNLWCVNLVVVAFTID